MTVCNHTCTNCGKHETGNWTHSDELIAAQLCFGCNFWTEHEKEKDSPSTVRIDGTHYHIGKETSSYRACRGFGGRHFRIQFHDGRIVETTNLWCQGDIPKHFRDRLPDNAIFI
jgi:hypothetical protein